MFEGDFNFIRYLGEASGLREVKANAADWWVQWAALGIGFAWVISLLRVIRAVIVLGGLAALVTYLRKK